MSSSRQQAGDYLAVPEPLGNAVCMVAVVALQHTNLICSFKLHATNGTPANTNRVTNQLDKILHCTLSTGMPAFIFRLHGHDDICDISEAPLGLTFTHAEVQAEVQAEVGSRRGTTGIVIQILTVAHTVRSQSQFMHRHQLQSTHCSVPVSWLWSGLCCAYAILHRLSMMLWAAPLLTTPTVSPRACSCYTAHQIHLSCTAM